MYSAKAVFSKTRFPSPLTIPPLPPHPPSLSWVAGFAVRVVAAILQSLVGLFSFLTDAFFVVKAFCHNFALLCHDILTQIEVWIKLPASNATNRAGLWGVT